MNIKKIITIVLLYFLNINYANSIEADIFVQSTVNRASKVLSENISKEEKINELKLIAKETVDIKGIGFYTLGSARKNLNEDNKNPKKDKKEESKKILSLKDITIDYSKSKDFGRPFTFTQEFYDQFFLNFEY